MSPAEEFAFVPQATNNSFEDVGFGPFVVERRAFISEIINTATPKKSVHINGCRAAGKTTVLNQVGQALQAQNKRVFMFPTSSALSRETVIQSVKSLAASPEPTWLLIDETQDNVGAELFNLLLKNVQNHAITTIGAGVPEFQSTSQKFKKKFGTEHLFLTSNRVMVDEGVVQYFERVAAATNGTGTVDTSELGIVLEYIRNYVGGHIYPLMWHAERLVQRLATQACNTAQAIDYLHSTAFRNQEEYQEMVDRCLPDISTTNVRPLLYKTLNPTLLYDLKRKGFCDKDNKVISQLLFQEFVAKISSSHSFSQQLSPGVGGVRQLLQFALPKLNWDQYNAFGGPIEDALTLELLIVLSGVSFLQTRLFNPKLINAGTAVRKPDLYLNSSIDAFVECVLTTAKNNSEVAKL